MAAQTTKGKDPTRAWYDTKPYAPNFAAAAIDRFDSHQERLRKSRLYDRMRRSWLTYYSRDSKDAGCDNTDISLAGERGELLILKPNRFRRLINDQLDVVRQTLPDYEPIAINTDAESQAQVQLVLSLLDDSSRRHNRPAQRVLQAEVAALFGEGILHGRWDGDRGKVAMVDNQGEPIYEGDHVWSVRTPYEVAYDMTSPDQNCMRWKIVHEPENKFDLLAEFGDDGGDIEHAILSANAWSRHFVGDKMFGRDEIEFDDSIGVFHVYVEPCKSCPEGRYAKVLDSRTVLLDGPLDEKTAGVFILRPSTVIFKNEGYTNNFGGLSISEGHSAIISTLMSNADAHGLQRMLTPRESNLSDVDKGAGLIWMPYDHKDANGEDIPEPHMLQVAIFPPELLSLEQLLARELDTVMGGSAVTRGDPEATKGDSGSKSAMLYAAAQSVGNGFMTAVLRLDADRATWEIDSYKRHATVERVVAIVGQKNTYTAKKWKAEDLSAIDRVNVRSADASRDSFTGRMTMAELFIGQPPEQRRELQAFVQTGRIESVTEDIDTARILIERENEAIRSGKGEVIVRPSDPHREHIANHLKLENDDEVRRDPGALARNAAHLAQHVAALTPGSPAFDAEILMLTGQQPLGISPTVSNSGAGTGNPGPNDAQAPGGAPSPAAGPASDAGPGLPKPAQQPQVPSTGERLNLPPPPTPTVGVTGG